MPASPALIDNDCGSGAGGFKPGNTCAKGGSGSEKPSLTSMTKTMGDALDSLSGKKITPDKLAAALPNVSPQAVQQVMSKLYQSGFVSKEKDGFRISQRGSTLKGTLRQHLSEMGLTDNEQSESLERITANLSGKVRREELDGRKYLVAPLSMIVPGVLNGSKGPLYYSAEEIGKDYGAWNAIPIVVEHPVDNDGNPISARSPRVLNKQGIGHVFEAKHNGRLEAEGWFDEVKTRKVSAKVYNSLINGKPIELSTGLFTDNIPAQNGANHNGKPYTHVARNFKPDHLAILPGSKGACSLNDGCGVMVNESKTLKEKFKALATDMVEVVNKIVGNDLPKSIKVTANCGDDCECDSCKEKAKENKQSEETPDEVVTLSHETNTELEQVENTAMAKKEELIESLVANCDCDENKAKSRKVYETLNEEALGTLVTNMAPKSMPKKGAKAKNGEDQMPTDQTEEDETDKEAKKKAKSMGLNQEQTVNDKPLTEEEWLAKAPARLRNVMNKALTFEETQREQLADRIVANAAKKGITVNKEALLEKDSSELEFMANISSEPTREAAFNSPIYLGASAPVANYSSKSFKDEDADMMSPTINWKEESEKRKAG